MSGRPYQPFYKPYGMTDEEYEYEKRIAAEKLAEWEQEQNESNLLDAQVILPSDNTMNENGCATCEHIDKDGKYPCKVCGDTYPYDMFQARSK